MCLDLRRSASLIPGGLAVVTRVFNVDSLCQTGVVSGRCAVGENQRDTVVLCEDRGRDWELRNTGSLKNLSWSVKKETQDHEHYNFSPVNPVSDPHQ